ncbi:Wzz/FepE/Etk N-terminal domain-containing protein [Reichenbachiella versicolor]|uniref:Wzz/FepE/Etk N-terminal domain-containing protein n=1 Tax=Reichenbachiella versicolor TaxID=1821036 RepID=UPI000D6E9072|nr:Wzz/FepE/Etk N-terminal domain-containing protein [Reichenbachiella versicolor]
MKTSEGREEDVDLIELVQYIWVNRVNLIKIALVFFVFGLVLSFCFKTEYEALCKLLPENQEGIGNKFSGLSGLAGLAGISLDGIGESSTLSPAIFPEIIYSVPFLDFVYNTNVYFEKADTIVSPKFYFKELDRPSVLALMKNYTIGLPHKLIRGYTKKGQEKQVSKTKILRYSKEEFGELEGFKDRILIEVDEETGIIQINLEMPDPIAAAELLVVIKNKLTQELTSYKTQKAIRDHEFISQRYFEAKQNFSYWQKKLAAYRDKNNSVMSQSATVELERLVNDHSIAYEVYRGLASQLEQSKIHVKKETPIFTVLEPVRIPEDKSQPNKKLITALFTFLGILVGVGWLISKYVLFGK